MSHPPRPVFALRSMAVRAGINQVVCLLTALVLWLFRVDASFWVSLVFSLLVGNACWLLIDGSRAVVGRWRHARRGGNPEWPGLAWMAAIVVPGSLLGYTLGHAAMRPRGCCSTCRQARARCRPRSWSSA